MAAIVAAASTLAIVFMAVFFVKLCAEGSHAKVCEVLQLDTESCAPPAVAPQTAGNVAVMPGIPDDRIRSNRSRKPA